MDLAVDEQGLWVLWGSPGNSNRLKAAKIDHKSNRTLRTWSLHTGIPLEHTNQIHACTLTCPLKVSKSADCARFLSLTIIIWLCLTRTGNYQIHEFD